MASITTDPITDSEVEAEFSEVKYSPFHKLHGSNIVLSKDGCVARREKGYDRAVIFSSQPIPVGSRFQVVIGCMEQEWSGSLRIGVTIRNPGRIIRFPASALECYHSREYWTLSGNRIYNRQKEKKSLVDMNELAVGHSVGCMVTKKGRLEIFVNGISLGAGWAGVPVDRTMWGFADLYGKTTEVRSNTVCDMGEDDLFAPRLTLASAEFNTQLSLPSQPAEEVDSVIQQRDEDIAALRQELAAERQSKNELTTTWEMANVEFMQMQKDHKQEMKEVHHQLAESRRQLNAVQSHVQQVLGLQQNVANGESHGSLTGNVAGADSNSVHSMLHLLKERLHELLTGERGAASGGYTGQIRTMSLPIGVKEGVTVNYLLSGLKQKLSAGQQEEQFFRGQLEARDKRIKALEDDISHYQVALAQLDKDREPLESAYEAKYLVLWEELQEYVSSFKDNMKETQRELEGVRGELADVKRVVEVNNQPIEQVQECEDEDASDQCPSDDKGSSEGEGEGDSIVQEEDMTVVPEDASSGDQ